MLRRKLQKTWTNDPYKSLLKAVEQNRPDAICQILEEDNARETPVIDLAVPVYMTESYRSYYTGEKIIGVRETLIMLAINKGHFTCVEAMAKHRYADKYDHARYGHALFVAVARSMKELVALLLARGASISDKFDNQYPLEMAIKNDDAEMTALICAYRPDDWLNQETRICATVLRPPALAVFHQSWKSLTAMLAITGSKISDSLADAYGSALYYMSERPSHFNFHVASRLLKALDGKPVFKKTNSNNNTCLHAALWSRNTEMVAMLSCHTGLLQEKNVHGETPLGLSMHAPDGAARSMECLDQAREMHKHYRFSTARSLLTLFISAQNSTSQSPFRRLPLSILELIILPFVTTEIQKKQKTIKARKQYLPRLFQWHKEQKQFQIQSQQEMKRTTGFRKRIMSYLSDPHTQNALVARGLVQILPPEPEEKHEEIPVASPKKDQSLSLSPR